MRVHTQREKLTHLLRVVFLRAGRNRLDARGGDRLGVSAASAGTLFAHFCDTHCTWRSPPACGLYKAVDGALSLHGGEEAGLGLKGPREPASSPSMKGAALPGVGAPSTGSVTRAIARVRGVMSRPLLYGIVAAVIVMLIVLVHQHVNNKSAFLVCRKASSDAGPQCVGGTGVYDESTNRKAGPQKGGGLRACVAAVWACIDEV
jgi:hypothetical protein